MAKRKKTPPVHRRKLSVNYSKQEVAYLETGDQDGEKWEVIAVEYYPPRDRVYVRKLNGLWEPRLNPHWPTSVGELKTTTDKWAWDQATWDMVFEAVGATGVRGRRIWETCIVID